MPFPNLNTDLRELTEKQWDTQLFNSKDGLATRLGWTMRYHTLRSKGSQSGFPDRVLIRERIIFAELKREGGKPTETQRAWLTAIAKAGGECYLWRPSDLDEIGRVLSKRWSFDPAFDVDGMWALYSENDGGWTPDSLWLADGCRADDLAPVPDLVA